MVGDNVLETIHEYEVVTRRVQARADVITSKNFGKFAQVSKITMSFSFFFGGRCRGCLWNRTCRTLRSGGCVFLSNSEGWDFGKDDRYREFTTGIEAMDEHARPNLSGRGGCFLLSPSLDEVFLWT